MFSFHAVSFTVLSFFQRISGCSSRCTRIIFILALPRIWLSRSTSKIDALDDDETLCLGPQAEGLRCRQGLFFSSSTEMADRIVPLKDTTQNTLFITSFDTPWQRAPPPTQTTPTLPKLAPTDPQMGPGAHFILASPEHPNA